MALAERCRLSLRLNESDGRGQYSHDLIVDRAIEFIRSNRDRYLTAASGRDLGRPVALARFGHPALGREFVALLLGC